MSGSRPTGPSCEPAPGEKHEDQIRADRACIGCGFNLFGQSVYREPHYNLAIARCPECGEIAALQTYPVMTHWVNRFRALIAGVWVLALIFMFAMQISMIGSYTESVNGDGGSTLAVKIGEAYYRWTESQGTAADLSGWPPNRDQYYLWIDIPSDWSKQHLGDTISAAGGLCRNLNREGLFYLLPASIFAFVMGVFWSVTLLGCTRKRAVLVPLTAALFSVVLFYATYVLPDASLRARELASQRYGELLTPVLVLLQLPTLFLGVFVGRKLTRWVIRLALPPRARIPFAVLWTRDGLSPPKPTFD